MKVALVCSHGGHFTETLQILDAFERHDFFFVTYHSPRSSDVEKLGRCYLTDNIERSIWRMVRAFFWAFYILYREKPDVIVSLGAEIAVPFFYLARLLSIKTIFIESWCRTENLSQTGRLVYPVADVFLVQWPQLLSVCGSKAQYNGAVI